MHHTTNSKRDRDEISAYSVVLDAIKTIDLPPSVGILFFTVSQGIFPLLPRTSAVCPNFWTCSPLGSDLVTRQSDCSWWPVFVVGIGFILYR